MATVADLIEAFGTNVITALEMDMQVPVLDGLQRQGDVLIRPADVRAYTSVPATGTPVVRGENGGNTHAIYAADGPVFCDVSQIPNSTDLRAATLTVPDGSTAYLGHPEHGYMGVAPGSYEIRRQREMAEEMRMVAD